MAADHDVVSNLHKVVDLGSLTDYGVADRSTVDGGVGPDLYIVLNHHPTDLGYLLMPLRTHGEAESILTDPCSRVQDHAIADERVNDCRMGAHHAVPPDLHAGPDHGIGPDDRAAADLRPRPDDRAGIDRHTILKTSIGMDEGARRDAAGSEGGDRPHGLGIHSGEDQGERPVGFVADKRDRAGRELRGEARRHQAGGRRRRLERIGIARVVQERERRRSCLGERRHTLDAQVEVDSLWLARSSPRHDLCDRRPAGRSEKGLICRHGFQR